MTWARRSARTVVEGALDAEVDRGHRLHERLLAEVEADHVLDVGVDELVVGHAGPEGVDDADAAGGPRLEQQRRDRGQGAVVVAHPVLVRAAVDDVDAPPAVAQHEAAAAPCSRSSRVTSGASRRRATSACSQWAAPPGPSVSTTRHGSAPAPSGTAARSASPEQGERPLGIGLVEPERLGDRVAGGDGVGQARRRAEVVLEDEQGAARLAHDVEAGHADRRRAGGQAPGEVGLEALGAVEHRGREDALGDDAPRAVGVGDEGVQRPDALLEPGSQRRPLAGREQAGDRVDRERLGPEGHAARRSATRPPARARPARSAPSRRSSSAA